MGASFSTSTIFRGVDRMSPVMDKMSKRTSRFGDTLKAVLSANIITAGFNRLVGGIQSGITTFIDFETAMAKVATISNETTQTFAEQSKEMIKLSNALGLPALELAEAQYQAISAGVSDSAEALKLVEVASKTAIGGFTDTTTAVDGLTTILNAYGLESKEATRISDQLIATQNFGKTTFGQMAQSLGNVVPIAASLKLGTVELFGAIATLTKQGIKTPMAMTQIKAALSNILKPSAQAAVLAEDLELSFSGLALQSKGLAGFLNDVIDKTGGSQEKIAKLFGSTEALGAVMALTANDSKILAESLNVVDNSTGSLDESFERMSNTLGFRFGAVKNRFTNFALAMADSMSPLFNSLINVTERINFDKLSGDMSSFIETFDFEAFGAKIDTGVNKFIEAIPMIKQMFLESVPPAKEFLNVLVDTVKITYDLITGLTDLLDGPIFTFMKWSGEHNIINALTSNDRKADPNANVQAYWDSLDNDKEAPNQAEARAITANVSQNVFASKGIDIATETTINGAPPIKRDQLSAGVQR